MIGKRVLLESDLDISVLAGKQIAIIGYGSQGRAQALNLKDSGFSPLIGVRPGQSFDRACRDGFSTLAVDEASRRSDVIVLLTPDESQAHVCKVHILPNAKRGVFLGFATGFNVHFDLVDVPAGVHVFLTAPKGPGEVLRKRFEQGGGIPALVASRGEDPSALAVGMAYAKAIGCARAGVIKTTFEEEAVADLFGEQCVLSGGMIELMKAAFGVLVRAGYSPEVAYIECVAEVEYMASLISRVGLARLGEHVSTTAHYGGLTRGRRIIDDEARHKLQIILQEIQNGRFLQEFLEHAKSGKRMGEPDELYRKLEQARANLGTDALNGCQDR